MERAGYVGQMRGSYAQWYVPRKFKMRWQVAGNVILRAAKPTDGFADKVVTLAQARRNFASLIAEEAKAAEEASPQPGLISQEAQVQVLPPQSEEPQKKKRGRPKGSKNRKRIDGVRT